MGLLDQFKAYIDANTPRSTRPAVSPQNVIYAGLLQQPIENIKANAAGLLGEIQRAPQDLAALASPQMYAQALKAMNTPQPVDKQKWIDAGMELSGMAPLGGLMAHTVYHGSPHKFTKFDMSKIGTGEGAQAYGHGLYFAENPGVAKTYQNMGPREWFLNGEKFDPSTLKGGDKQAWNTYLKVRAMGQDPMEYAAKLMDEGKMSLNQYGRISKYAQAELRDPIGGNLYKVDIPDEAIPRMLDWDKPLSEQAPEVQKALASNPNYEKYWLPHMERKANMTGTNPGGDSLVRYLREDYDPQEVADLLHSQGIKGIRYLDGSSRNAGQGTSNFVLFDDQLPRILEVNGQPTGLLSYADEAARKPKPKKAK